MRLECECRGWAPDGVCAADGGVEHGLVAAMHPVEIADRQHGAAQALGLFGPMRDDKRLWKAAHVA
jgi:hypothetical protein